jgi:hypothetical protein
MTQREIQTAVVVGLVAAMLTWWTATSDHSPLKPHQDRPVLRLIQRIARVGLWVMWCAEPPPAEQAYVVHARVDADGNRVLNHGQGW